MSNAVLEAMRRFGEAHAKERSVDGIRWRYYALGEGPPILWLTGGLRRAAFGFAFLERLARRHRVVAPDYPPLMTFDAMAGGFDALVQAEGLDRLALGGQSYGGMLAQGYLARRPQAIERLVLSSTGPAGYAPWWAVVDDIAIALVRILPERRMKQLLATGLGKVLTTPEGEEAEWHEAMDTILQQELKREDVVSHFAVAADLIRSRRVRPEALATWAGRAFVLTAEDDPTQSPKDIAAYATLLGRQPEVLSLGRMGHTAALRDPDAYVEILEQALS